MLMDALTQFSDALAVTSSAISNVIDTGADSTLKQLGGVGATFLVVQCDESATASGSATVTFSLESDSTADLATSATVHLATAAVPKASLLAGATVAVLPLPYADYERYLGVRYTVATGPLTAGKFSAFLTNSPQFWKPLHANNPIAS